MNWKQKQTIMAKKAQKKDIPKKKHKERKTKLKGRKHYKFRTLREKIVSKTDTINHSDDSAKVIKKTKHNKNNIDLQKGIL